MRKYMAVFMWFYNPYSPRKLEPGMIFKDDKKRTIKAKTDREALAKTEQIVRSLRKSGKEPWWTIRHLEEVETKYVVFFMKSDEIEVVIPRD